MKAPSTEVQVTVPDVVYVGTVPIHKDDKLTLFHGSVLRIEREGCKIFVPVGLFNSPLVSILFTPKPTNKENPEDGS